MDITNKAYEKIALALKSKATSSLDDALFISKESRNPAHVVHLTKLFAQGFISHPESWWATNIQVLAALGYLGQSQKSLAIVRQAIFSSLIGFGIRHPVRTGRLVFWTRVGHLDEFVSAIAGRYAGAKLITEKAIFTEKYGVLGKSKSSALLKLALKFVHSSYGLGMLAISQGVRSLENLLFSMITGSKAVLDGNFYSELDHLNISDYEAWQEYEEIKLVLQKLIYLNTNAGYHEHAQHFFI